MTLKPKLDNIRLLVNDFNACLAFYRDVMGYTLPEGHGFPYVEFDTGGAQLALFDRKFMAQAIGTADLPAGEPLQTQDRAALIFLVDSVDQAYEELSRRGAQFTTMPQDRAEWGLRTAHLRDPDGNLLELYHSL